MTAPRSLIITGSLELQADALAERIAHRVAELLATQPTGSETYERELAPDPGAGERRGARFGGVLENGTVEHDDPGPGR